MAEMRRESPVRFTARPAQSEVRDNWTVVLAYEDEGPGPWLVNLAHKTRWDLQDSRVGVQIPCDQAVPETPGDCAFDGITLINRMNRTQASIYHLGAAAPAMPDFAGYTDVSEATVFLAMFGPRVFAVAEKLTPLDFLDPAKEVPFLLQGPFCHVPCQIVALERSRDGSGGFLLTCSRGYGDALMHAIMQAGAEFGLRQAGERAFLNWLPST